MNDVNPYRMQLLSLLLALIVSALLEMSATAPATPGNNSHAVAGHSVTAACSVKKEPTGKLRGRQRGTATNC